MTDDGSKPISDVQPAAKKISAVKIGIAWGGAMFVLFEIQMVWMSGFSWGMTIFNAICWTIGGTAFGWFMKWALSRKWGRG